MSRRERELVEAGARRKERGMSGWNIAGLAVAALVALGLATNGRDLMRYFKISSM